MKLMWYFDEIRKVYAGDFNKQYVTCFVQSFGIFEINSVCHIIARRCSLRMRNQRQL